MTQTKQETRGRHPLAEDDKVVGGLFESQRKELDKVVSKPGPYYKWYRAQLVRFIVNEWLARHYRDSGETYDKKEDDVNFEQMISESDI